METIIKDKSKKNFLRLKEITDIQMNALIMLPAKSMERDNAKKHIDKYFNHKNKENIHQAFK